mmetsp:Transcript_33060/g.65560  ORF Transcript_33060/g.65560 Transcript_33060/m.65560 type:complete len:158 (-) Transcript_33060:25-498(-)
MGDEIENFKLPRVPSPAIPSFLFVTLLQKPTGLLNAYKLLVVEVAVALLPPTPVDGRQQTNCRPDEPSKVEATRELGAIATSLSFLTPASGINGQMRGIRLPHMRLRATSATRHHPSFRAAAYKSHSVERSVITQQAQAFFGNEGFFACSCDAQRRM